MRSRLASLTRRIAAAPPERIADGVWIIRGGLTRAMNAFLIEGPDGVVVFDTGEKGMAPAILAAAAPLGGIDRVVLGHGDTDHRGAAPALSAVAPVLSHPDAVVHAEGSGGRDYWRPELLPAAVRRFHAVMHHVWDGGPVTINGTVEDGDEIAGFRVVALPGHAPGLIALWREHDRLALCSDALYMTDMWGRPQEPALPLAAYNHDSEQAAASLRRLAALEPLSVWPGHRGPVTGDDLRVRLEAAADAGV